MLQHTETHRPLLGHLLVRGLAWLALADLAAECLHTAGPLAHSDKQLAAQYEALSPGQNFGPAPAAFNPAAPATDASNAPMLGLASQASLEVPAAALPAHTPSSDGLEPVAESDFNHLSGAAPTMSAAKLNGIAPAAEDLAPAAMLQNWSDPTLWAQPCPADYIPPHLPAPSTCQRKYSIGVSLDTSLGSMACLVIGCWMQMHHHDVNIMSRACLCWLLSLACTWCKHAINMQYCKAAHITKCTSSSILTAC